MSRWEEIINNFNFDKVHAYMVYVNWKWIDNNDFSVPTIQQLKDTAAYLIGLVENEIYRDPEKCHTIGTGGFEATYSSYSKKITLKFVLTHATENIK